MVIFSGALFTAEHAENAENKINKSNLCGLCVLCGKQSSVIRYPLFQPEEPAAANVDRIAVIGFYRHRIGEHS